MRNLLGGKGANLAEMTNIGLPVPQGFTVTTEACTRYYDDGKIIADEIVEQIYDALAEIEKINGKKFGDLENPLPRLRPLRRARFHARHDGHHPEPGPERRGRRRVCARNRPAIERFAYDSYRRFIQMFSDVVMEIPKNKFEDVLDEMKEEEGRQVRHRPRRRRSEGRRRAASRPIYQEKKGVDFPQDPKVQLMEAVKAVFRSWDNPRAIVYRRMNDIPCDWGTAVNVQSMVFGNMGETSGTGVAFTRNPATGEKKLFGEYLINAQGEDVVAGIRTPAADLRRWQQDMPEVYEQFVDIANKLEDALPRHAGHGVHHRARQALHAADP